MTDKKLETGGELRRYQFFIPMKKIPTTAQQKKIAVKKSKWKDSQGREFIEAKPIVYEDAQLGEARAMLMSELWQRSPETPMGGNLSLVTIWCFPIPKYGKAEVYGEDGEKIKVCVSDGSRKGTRPDTDNLVKLFKDVMTAVGFWYDDSQVCSESISKIYGSVVGVYVEVGQMETFGKTHRNHGSDEDVEYPQDTEKDVNTYGDHIEKSEVDNG